MVTRIVPLWTRRLAAFVVCLCAIGVCESHSPIPEPQSSPPSISISAAASPAGEREIALDDMVSLREVHEPRLSPDGRQVAFLVKQAFRSCDCYRVALYLARADGRGQPRKLVEEDDISQLRWNPLGGSVSYLSSKGGSLQLWQFDVRERVENMIFSHAPNSDRSGERALDQPRHPSASGVLEYWWSPDGSRIAFVAEPSLDPSLSIAAAKEGFRYDDTTMSITDLIVGDWGSAKRTKQLWLYDIKDQRERLMWTTANQWFPRISGMVWSPSGKHLAVFHSGVGGPANNDMDIIDAGTSNASPQGSMGGAIYSSNSAAWSYDERAIAYLANSPLGPSTLYIANLIDHSKKEISRNIKPSVSPWLRWDSRRHTFLLLSDGIGSDRKPTGLYRMPETGGEPSRLTASTDKLDDCDALSGEVMTCVRQAVSMPPAPVTLRRNGDSTIEVAEVNPELRSIKLQPVQERRWKNEYGDATNGYLILPPRNSNKGRVPLVLIGYGFSGDFVTQASSTLTTFPAQALARDGIAVLLFNYPRIEPWEGPNFERGSRAFGYGPLSSMQAIIKQLDAEGIIDPQRVGMMGHSLAGFWVQFAISRTNLFSVVEMNNGGTASEPGTYWINGTKTGRELQEMVMGGPPYGDTLKNYVSYSFTLNASRVRAPVLMQYDAVESRFAMEYFEALEHYQAPVEFYVYPNDGHVTARPEHRYMSMQRNLDWFEFWLLGKENDAESKDSQYTRWRQLRERQHERAT